MSSGEGAGKQASILEQVTPELNREELSNRPTYGIAETVVWEPGQARDL